MDKEKDPTQIVNLGLWEFASDLAWHDKEDNPNPAVSSRQPPSRDVKAGPFILGEALPVVPARLTKKIL